MREVSDRASQAREDRAFTLTQIDVRADDDSTITFDGVASVVDTPYTVRDMFGEFSETVAKGAFNRTLKQRDDVRLLVNHDGIPLARTKSKTLSLSAEPDLRAVASLDPANPTVQEIRSAMGRGDMDQMSIGFQVKDDRWNADYTERTIREVKLFDVSVVTFPASTSTKASLRSLDDAMADLLAERDEWDPDMLRRAIARLEELLPKAELVQPHVAARKELLARKLPLAV